MRLKHLQYVLYVTKKWQVLILNNCYIIGPTRTFFMWFRVALEIQLDSYGPRNALVIL